MPSTPPSALTGISPSRGESSRSNTSFLQPLSLPKLANAYLRQRGRRDSFSPVEGEMPGKAEGGEPRLTALMRGAC